MATEKLKVDIDYYYENDKMVLTSEYLKKIGRCCGNKCKNCPYYPKYTKRSRILSINI